MSARTFAVGLALCALAGALPAAADEPAAAPTTAAADDAATRWGYQLAQELLSPFCPGRALADCPSPDAASLRMWILVQAAAGRTRADVERELYERYGETIRPTPKVEGIGLAAYLIPIVAFAGGGALVMWFLRGATRRAAEQPAPMAAALDPEVERRLDDALSR